MSLQNEFKVTLWNHALFAANSNKRGIASSVEYKTVLIVDDHPVGGNCILLDDERNLDKCARQMLVRTFATGPCSFAIALGITLTLQRFFGSAFCFFVAVRERVRFLRRALGARFPNLGGWQRCRDLGRTPKLALLPRRTRRDRIRWGGLFFERVFMALSARASTE